MRDSDPIRHLAEAAIEGDDVAFAALVRATQPAVWRLCTALGSPGVEEDLVQETYLRVIKALPGFRFEVPVQAWLLSIARRVCADDVRRRTRRRRLHDRLEGFAQDVVQLDHHSVDDLLDGLAPDRRDAFVLTQVLGLSYEEAAEVMGCPIGTVRSRVARARADLAGTVERALAR
ncbi:MAG: sigma-70 family RNA polymerase sigma factor [Ilumatobacteraceae bacterium]